MALLTTVLRVCGGWNANLLEDSHDSCLRCAVQREGNHLSIVHSCLAMLLRQLEGLSTGRDNAQAQRSEVQLAFMCSAQLHGDIDHVALHALNSKVVVEVRKCLPQCLADPKPLFPIDWFGKWSAEGEIGRQVRLGSGEIPFLDILHHCLDRILRVH